MEEIWVPGYPYPVPIISGYQLVVYAVRTISLLNYLFYNMNSVWWRRMLLRANGTWSRLPRLPNYGNRPFKTTNIFIVVGKKI